MRTRTSLAAVLCLFAAACDKDSATPAAHAAGAPAVQAAASTAAPSAKDEGFVVTELSPTAGKLAPLVAAEIAKADKLGLKPFLEVSATWCGPCQKLKESLHTPKMVDAFRGTYIVKLDLDAWESQLDTLGAKVDAIPVFFQLGKDGHVGRALDGGAWKNDVPDEMAPPLKKFFHS